MLHEQHKSEIGSQPTFSFKGRPAGFRLLTSSTLSSVCSFLATNAQQTGRPITVAAVSVAGMRSFFLISGEVQGVHGDAETRIQHGHGQITVQVTVQVSFMKVARADTAVHMLHFAGAALPLNNNNFLLKTFAAKKK